MKVQSREEFSRNFHQRELAAAAVKREMALDWLPEYQPVSTAPPHEGGLAVLQRQTRISPAMILQVHFVGI